MFYRHHRSRAGARHEYFAGIHIVLADGPGYHVGNRVAIAAAVVGQSSLRTDVPAGSAVGA